jgi:hypothetical protein
MPGTGALRQRDSLSFTADPNLSNAKFESYKLNGTSDQSTCHSASLPSPGPQWRSPPENTRFSYAELQARAKHNHLAVGDEGELLYIDQSGQVIAVDVLSVSAQGTAKVI